MRGRASTTRSNAPRRPGSTRAAPASGCFKSMPAATSVLVIDLDHTRAGVLKLIDGVNVIAHNIAFELAFLEQAGVALGEMQCTLQAAG